MNWCPWWFNMPHSELLCVLRPQLLLQQHHQCYGIDLTQARGVSHTNDLTEFCSISQIPEISKHSLSKKWVSFWSVYLSLGLLPCESKPSSFLAWVIQLPAFYSTSLYPFLTITSSLLSSHIDSLKNTSQIKAKDQLMLSFGSLFHS